MGLTEKTISKKLRELGMPSNIYGFNYIKTALQLISEDETFLKRITTTSGLYATISKKYNTTVARTERNIRHAKEVVLSRGNTTELGSWDSSKDMTNGQFIGAIYECLKYDRSDEDE